MGGNIGLDEALLQYIRQCTRESDVAKRLRAETLKLSQSRMLTTPDQAHFLALLVRLVGAKHILEIGTFTGYSALAMAKALPKDGTLIACDVSTQWTDIGRSYWKEAGVESKIDLRIAPALETVAVLQKTHAGKFDMAFIDADKANYDLYYEAVLTLVRNGGLIAFDNMLWSGEVANPENQEKQTKAIRALNAKIAGDSRVDSSLLTVADGMMLALKVA